MSKIKVNDLKKLAKEVNDIEILYVTIDETGEIFYEVSIKQYLNYLDKINLVSSMYNSAINNEDELQVIDCNVLDMVYKVLVVQEYSNINLPQTTSEDGTKSADIVLAHDLLLKSGLYEKVYNAIPEFERYELDVALRSYITKKEERYERENTLPNIVKNILNGLVDKIPSADEAKLFIEQASKELNNLNPDNLEFVKAFMAKTSGEDIG